MQWNTDLTTQRIDCAAADLIDRLYAEQLPSPCLHTQQEVWDWLCQTYPVQLLPPEHILYARTALAILDTCFPEDAEYLPDDPDERLEAARSHLTRLQIRCGQLKQEGAALPLYDEQRKAFEQRAARFGLVWKPQPITVCMGLTSQYRLASGSQTLSDQLTVVRGVSQEDLDDRSAELLAYLRARHALESR
ncbi:MAG: hypothetical protein ACI4PM_03200 [Butyricicoccus sp.]